MDDTGEYCRQVEDHLTRVNGGHLVRIVGPGFELVRQWALEGIPLSVVVRGIELKADRHRLGNARRPLRIEFCEGDIRDLYDAWRRAVGLPRGESTTDPDEASASPEVHKRPSLSKHLDRVIERLSRVTGRLEWPESFRETLGGLLQEVTTLRELARTARGSLRDDLVGRLGPLDVQLMSASRIAAPPELLTALAADAALDLAPFRERLNGEAWQQAVDVTVDRLLRDRYGLPTILMP